MKERILDKKSDSNKEYKKKERKNIVNKKETVKERPGNIKREEHIVNHKERVKEKILDKEERMKIFCKWKKKEWVVTNKEKKWMKIC